MNSWILQFLWITIQIVFGYNLVLPIVLYTINFFKIIRSSKNNIVSDIHPDYGIIITAYEQTHSLPAVISSILKLKYKRFLIYIVADNCDISTLYFNSDCVILLRPEEILGSNTRSHFYAISRFKRNHTHLTIIDSDNLVDSNYLGELNKYFDKGFEAVQGIRKAKNLNTIYACLDAARDMYYHFYDGKILFSLGSSATLAGSGMAFTVNLYKKCLEHLNIEGAGFDKVLQSAIVERNLRIAFAEHAIVYDEKTSIPDQLVKQRSRWINTWFKYFNLSFRLIRRGMGNYSLNQIIFGFILLRPPLFFFILASLLCMIINVWTSMIGLILWLIAFLLFTIGFVIALVYFKADSRIYNSLIDIPKFIFFQVLSLLKSRRANQNSVATEHYHSNNLEN